MSPAALRRPLDPAYIGARFALQMPFLEGSATAPTPLDLTGCEVLLFLDRQGLPDHHVEIPATDAGGGVALFEAETDDWPRGDYTVEVRLDGVSVVVGRLPVAQGAAANGSDMVGAAQPPMTQGVLIAGTGVVQVVLPPQGLPGHTPTDEEIAALVDPKVASATASLQAALDALTARVAALETGGGVPVNALTLRDGSALTLRDNSYLTTRAA